MGQAEANNRGRITILANRFCRTCKNRSLFHLVATLCDKSFLAIYLFTIYLKEKHCQVKKEPGCPDLQKSKEVLEVRGLTLTNDRNVPDILRHKMKFQFPPCRKLFKTEGFEKKGGRGKLCDRMASTEKMRAF